MKMLLKWVTFSYFPIPRDKNFYSTISYAVAFYSCTLFLFKIVELRENNNKKKVLKFAKKI